MNAAWVCLAGLAVFALGYRFYSALLAGRVFGLRPDEPVPSVTQADGVDYVPTHRAVLLGHHYASVAGAAPIIGPAIAVVWGWVPAILWVIFGAVFMGAVHDFATLVMSVRHRGESVGTIAASVLAPRTRTLFLLVIFFLIFLVIAVFAKAIAGLFVKQPGTVIPINFSIIVALVIGWHCHKQGAKLLWPSIGALVALYAMVGVGWAVPVSIGHPFGLDPVTTWVILLLIYSFVASILPVWMLLQPRDFVNSHQLILGLSALVLGVLVGHPTIVAPAFHNPGAGHTWFPFLFVTIACGAISGFHGLVSSGTSSKQLACATDARLVGYGAMLGEGLLALIATLAVSAGIADWAGHYHHIPSSKEGVALFVQGSSTFLVALGLPSGFAQVVVAVLVISFASTSLDTGVRIQRYILQELATVYRIAPLKNRYVAGLVSVVLPLILFLAGKEGLLWPLFGAANQMLAALSLVVVTVWLFRSRRPWGYTAVPMILVLAVSGTALTVQIGGWITTGNYLLATVATLLLALEAWIFLEGLVAMRRGRAPAAEAVASS